MVRLIAHTFTFYTFTFLLLFWPVAARAQVYESVGVRAQGMGGAFVALADDATASWWNPAGIASSSLLSLTAERTVTTLSDGLLPEGPTSRTGVTGVAVGIPSLVLSFYHIRINEIAPVPIPIEEDGSDRNTVGTSSAQLQAIAIRQYGATFGQSFGSHFVVASTARLLRGGVARGSEPVSGGGLDPAEDLDVPAHTTATFDLGVITAFGPLRAGGSVKYVNEPGLGEGDERLELERQARVGLAFLVGGDSTGLSKAVITADGDLTTATTLAGDVRHVAAGVEMWVGERRFGLRGGVSANTARDNEMSGSVGTTIGLKDSGFYVDAAATFGADKSRTGWAVGLGMTY